MKQNNMLAKFQAKLEAQYRAKLDVALQMGLDAGMIAANEVLSMGSGRAEAYRKAYIDAINEMAKLLAVDGADDPELDYSRDIIDRRIKSIVGDERFVPWDERYGQKKVK